MRYRASQEDLRRERETLSRERERHAEEVTLLEREMATHEAKYRRNLEDARQGSSSGGRK
jgi:hypothetical protein